MEETAQPEGQKLYYADGQGGIEFHSERRSGQVRIPNYVYDLWLPLIGTDGLAVYSLYCRLERSGKTCGLSTKEIAAHLRIGKATLIATHEKLEECGFIRIRRPDGQERFEHKTLEITTLDPPTTISLDFISRWAPREPGSDLPRYHPLTNWLVSNETLSTVLYRTADGSRQNRERSQIEPPLLQPLVLQPLEVAGSEHAADAVSPLTGSVAAAPSPSDESTRGASGNSSSAFASANSEGELSDRSTEAIANPYPSGEQTTIHAPAPACPTAKSATGRKPAPNPPAPPAPHQELMAGYQEALGYAIPQGAREGATAKRLLSQGWTPAQVLACYRSLKAEEFWEGRHLSLVSVEKQIGARWPALEKEERKRAEEQADWDRCRRESDEYARKQQEEYDYWDAHPEELQRRRTEGAAILKRVLAEGGNLFPQFSEKPCPKP